MVAIGSKYATFKDTKERGMWLDERRALTTQILEVRGFNFLLHTAISSPSLSAFCKVRNLGER